MSRFVSANRISLRLEKVIAALRKVVEGDLHATVEVHGIGDETTQIAETLNKTLDGIRTATEEDQISWTSFAEQRKTIAAARVVEEQKRQKLEEKVLSILALVAAASEGDIYHTSSPR